MPTLILQEILNPKKIQIHLKDVTIYYNLMKVLWVVKSIAKNKDLEEQLGQWFFFFTLPSFNKF